MNIFRFLAGGNKLTSGIPGKIFPSRVFQTRAWVKKNKPGLNTFHGMITFCGFRGSGKSYMCSGLILSQIQREYIYRFYTNEPIFWRRYYEAVHFKWWHKYKFMRRFKLAAEKKVDRLVKTAEDKTEMYHGREEFFKLITKSPDYSHLKNSMIYVDETHRIMPQMMERGDYADAIAGLMSALRKLGMPFIGNTQFFKFINKAERLQGDVVAQCKSIRIPFFGQATFSVFYRAQEFAVNEETGKVEGDPIDFKFAWHDWRRYLVFDSFLMKGS